nr:hypothetical protein BaRGS_021390 [Batillaria attramentaria]
MLFCKKTRTIYQRMRITFRLWHQLTLKLSSFVKTQTFAKGDSLVRLYENFITDFEHRINPLALTEICVLVVKQISGNIRLRNKDFENVKPVIEESQAILDAVDGVTSVHSRFYELTSNYHKLLGNHAEYYKEALRFLGCVQLSDISSGEQAERAFNLSLAAVLGDGVYNFGELLAHDILLSLKNTDKEWLVDLLYAFNSGNIAKFDELKKFWGTQISVIQSRLQQWSEDVKQMERLLEVRAQDILT